MKCIIEQQLLEHLRSLDARDDYEDTIYRLTNEYLESDDVDHISFVLNELSLRENEMLCTDLRTIYACRTEVSERQALGEIRDLLYKAARRIVERDYKEEMRHRAEDNALARWEGLLRRYA